MATTTVRLDPEEEQILADDLNDISILCESLGNNPPKIHR
jgi:hypothetical protein